MVARSRFVAAFAQHPSVAVMALVVAGATAVLLHMHRVSASLVEDGARRDARILALSLQEVRTLYTREVIEPLRAAGVRIAHETSDDALSVPVPATFAMTLADAISQQAHGARASLYSPFPFPWRASERGELTGFRREAWDALVADPERPFWRVETVDGEERLRYAISDRMRPSCVECHSRHPSSPQRRWSAGDVRGVLEVSLRSTMRSGPSMPRSCSRARSRSA